MSTCGMSKLRRINIEKSMEIIGVGGHQENGPGKINEIRDTKGVETNQTPPAPMEEGNAALSVDDDVDYGCRLGNVKDRKDSGKGKKNCGKFESGSGSGDQEVSHLDDSTDVSARKRKTRRGKPKHRKLKPYSKQPPYQERLRRRSLGRLMKKTTQPPAPYNTTQFLMEDHSDLPDLEEKLAKTSTNPEPTVNFQKPTAPPRTRDSSFSIDSDEDYFYSSPEDEEAFLTKEFSSAYEDLHAERLSALTKSELIQEYIQLEAKLDMLTKRMKAKNEIDGKNGDVEVAKKLKIYQQRIDDLMQQNDQLRRENEALRGKIAISSDSSVDSESDSDSDNSSTSGHSGCSCSEEGNVSPGYRRSNVERYNGRVPTDDNRESEARSVAEVSNGSATIQEIEGLPT